MSSTHRRRISGRNKVIGGLVAAAVAGGGAILFTGTAQAAGVGAAYTKTSDWSTGYTAQYVVTNNSGEAKSDWALEFDLPSGSKLSSLWNAESSVSGRRVTVKPPSWDKDGLAAGESVTVGFVVNGTGAPTGCLVDGAKCSADDGATPEPSGRPTEVLMATATLAESSGSGTTGVEYDAGGGVLPDMAATARGTRPPPSPSGKPGLDVSYTVPGQ